MDANDDSSDNEDPSFHVDDDDMFCDMSVPRRQISEMCKYNCEHTEESDI